MTTAYNSAISLRLCGIAEFADKTQPAVDVVIVLSPSECLGLVKHVKALCTVEPNPNPNEVNDEPNL
ncbi:MAG: hypothetical protein ACOYNN_17240 [Terrimicrobiaceae bacterium]